MPRIVFPVGFDSQLRLFKSIKQKHDADGPSCVLIVFLSENNIDLGNDDAAADASLVHHNAFEELSKRGEAEREERDIKIKLPWKHLKMCAQFLKALYPSAVRTLGDWSITVNNKNRLVYPRKFSDRISLVKNFIAKHNSFAAGSSPLEIFLSENDIDLAADLASALSSETVHDAFEKTIRQKESEREERDLLWKPVWKNVRGMGSYLKSLFAGKEHKAGDYGFTVNSPVRQKKIRKTRLGAGEFITLSNAVIGSTFSNLGNAELHIFKGRKKKGAPMLISANTKVQLPKGCSTCRVFNPSKAENALFTSFLYK